MVVPPQTGLNSITHQNKNCKFRKIGRGRTVYQNGTAVTDLPFAKSIVKGGEVSHAVPINRDGRQSIDHFSTWYRERYQNAEVSRPLFPSRNGQGTQQMSRRTAHDVLKKAFEDAGLNSHLATHSFFGARRGYDRSSVPRNVQDNRAAEIIKVR